MKLHFALAALLIAIVLPIAALACSHNETTKPSSFGIYLVDTGELMISGQHIKSYNTSTHEIRLNEEGITQWNSFFPNIGSLDGEEFAVNVNGEEIYRGIFQSPASSFAYIGKVTISYIPENDDIPIYYDCVDPRDDWRIINFFETESTQSSFGIYLVETGELVLSDEHIESYNASTHEMEMNKAGREKWNSYIISTPPTLAGSLFSKEFSLKINGEEIYRGTFWSWASSASCDGVIITEALFKLDEEYDTISIGYNCIDPRDDWWIFYFFDSEGLLK